MSKPPKYPIIDGIKMCVQCKIPLPVEKFYLQKNRSGTRSPTPDCCECRKKNSRRYFKKNHKRYLAKNREWREKNLDRFNFLMWRSTIMRRYKLTDAEYLRLAGDPPRCGICGAEPGKRRLAVDHCHKSKVIRGILCVLCNRALERMESVPDWHGKALQYLAKANAS